MQVSAFALPSRTPSPSAEARRSKRSGRRGRVRCRLGLALRFEFTHRCHGGILRRLACMQRNVGSCGMLCCELAAIYGPQIPTATAHSESTLRPLRLQSEHCARKHDWAQAVRGVKMRSQGSQAPRVLPRLALSSVVQRCRPRPDSLGGPRRPYLLHADWRSVCRRPA